MMQNLDARRLLEARCRPRQDVAVAVIGEGLDPISLHALGGKS